MWVDPRSVREGKHNWGGTQKKPGMKLWTEDLYFKTNFTMHVLLKLSVKRPLNYERNAF
jgi:hypothetical protein